jgi:predicted transcriptional regulator
MRGCANVDTQTLYPIISHLHLKYMVKVGKDKTISVRLSPKMLEELDARAILEEKDRTQVIREAIARHLGQAWMEVDEDTISYGMEVPITNNEDNRDSKLDLIEQRQDELYTLVNDLYDLFHRQEERNSGVIKLVNELASAVNERSQKLSPNKTRE